MCHAFLTDANFYHLLVQIDESIAEDVRARGCSCCGGALHSARYPRKPRGPRSALDGAYESRLSFCCAQEGCRRRSTPASVRFLGRKPMFNILGAESASQGRISREPARGFCVRSMGWFRGGEM